MIEKIPPAITGDTDPYLAARNVRATERGATTFRLANSTDLPSSPPPEVLSGLDSAARVHEELRAHGLNVSFDVQPDGGVRVSVVDENGAVVRSLSPSKALDALSGDGAIGQLGA